MDQVATSDALRDSTRGAARVPTFSPGKSRRERLRTPEATRVSAGEIARIAQEAVLPEGVTDVRMTTVVTPGDTLPNGTPSGRGGRTQHGPAWVIRGREESEPVHLFDSVTDALALYAGLVGEEGELWQRKQRRLEAIAAAEAAEAAVTAGEKDARAALKRLERQGVNTAEALGGGSSPRKRSSEKRSDESPPRKMRRASPRLFRTTSSPRSSS